MSSATLPQVPTPVAVPAPTPAPVAPPPPASMPASVAPTPLTARLPVAVAHGWVRPITPDEYAKMIDSGILGEAERVELLYGYLVNRMPINPPHDGTLDVIVGALLAVLPAGMYPRIQQSVRLAHSVPQPDVAVVRGNRRTYLTRHPGPADVALVVEVADSSVPRDRGDKIPLYAEAGVAEYWIVNIPDGQVEVYTQPSGPAPFPAYGVQVIYRPGDTVPLPAALGGAGVPAAELLP